MESLNLMSDHAVYSYVNNFSFQNCLVYLLPALLRHRCEFECLHDSIIIPIPISCHVAKATFAKKNWLGKGCNPKPWQKEVGHCLDQDGSRCMQLGWHYLDLCSQYWCIHDALYYVYIYCIMGTQYIHICLFEIGNSRLGEYVTNVSHNCLYIYIAVRCQTRATAGLVLLQMYRRACLCLKMSLSWNVGHEGDGFIIVQLYVSEIHCTEFAILDAKHVDPLTRTKLTHYISYGFHETFSPEVVAICQGPSCTLYHMAWLRWELLCVHLLSLCS